MVAAIILQGYQRIFKFTDLILTFIRNCNLNYVINVKGVEEKIAR